LHSRSIAFEISSWSLHPFVPLLHPFCSFGSKLLLLLLLLLLLISRLYIVFTSSCTHLTIIVSSSSSCLCHSSLLPSIPFFPSVPSAQVSLGLPHFLLPGGCHFNTSFGSLPSSIR